MSRPAAAILGLAGPLLSAEERALFRHRPPFGVILFARNIESPAQLRALTAELRDALDEAAPILVDQEGGRVARLGPPHWPAFPPAASFAGGPAEAARETARAIGAMCRAEGLTVVCAPCLDLRLPGAHAVIGDRAFSPDPAEVARLGIAWAAGLRGAGCTPVMKHLPGHGRADLDSHEALPAVAPTEADLRPFRDVAAADTHIWAMTGHLLCPALDAALPVTLSRTIIERVIRGEIGHRGPLLSDDLAMRALSGAPEALAEQALAAGCDLVLHCTGDFAGNAAILARCPSPSEAAMRRLADV